MGGLLDAAGVAFNAPPYSIQAENSAAPASNAAPPMLAYSTRELRGRDERSVLPVGSSVIANANEDASVPLAGGAGLCGWVWITIAGATAVSGLAEDACLAGAGLSRFGDLFGAAAFA